MAIYKVHNILMTEKRHVSNNLNMHICSQMCFSKLSPLSVSVSLMLKFTLLLDKEGKKRKQKLMKRKDKEKKKSEKNK